MEPLHGDDKPHAPPPTLWPVGFAVGIACVLVGLIVSPLVVAPIGAVITLVFGFLWVRDLTRDSGGPVAEVEPETRTARPAPPPIPANEGEAALPAPDSEEEIERFPRSKFLEGTTLGLGAVIGGIVTLPVVGFAAAPAFLHQGSKDVDLGPIDNFPEGQFVIATFMSDPAAGEVSRRTAYVRNNGAVEGEPSFTIVSNRCVHLGCPVQPNGPVFDDQAKKATTDAGEVTLIPTQPAGFGCPCHGGQYDTEGNRTAGPPVRALDRFEFSIKNSRLILGKPFSVGEVDGEGGEARIKKYRLAGPGEHVDGPESILYPLQPPH